MDDLASWLLAQVAEDEREATAAFSGQCDPENGWGISGRAITPHVGVIHEDVQRAHVAKWNPARVLAECEAKRLIVAEHHAEATALGLAQVCSACCTRTNDGDAEGDWPCATLRLLALPYADRPGYREEWRP